MIVRCLGVILWTLILMFIKTEQPQISYSFDFTAEQSRAIQSPNLLGREGSCYMLPVTFIYSRR